MLILYLLIIQRHLGHLPRNIDLLVVDELGSHSLEKVLYILLIILCSCNAQHAIFVDNVALDICKDQIIPFDFSFNLGVKQPFLTLSLINTI